MTIRIRQNISNLFDQNRVLIDSISNEIYIIYPEKGKKLKNIKTNEVYSTCAYANKKEDISKFIEI